jgi:ATP-binding cassette, subfamily B, heavy metal transporter
LSTIAGADQIHVLEEGALVESGRHEELLAAGGLYASMWRRQADQSDTAPARVRALKV